MATTRVTGSVKWFDLSKGYGFVTCPTLGKDAMLHGTAVRAFNGGEIYEGAMIEVDVVESDKGFSVSQIIMLEARVEEPIENFTRGSVKWYNMTKGFGFVTRGEGTRDLFLHAEVVKACGVSEVKPGQPVFIQFEENDKGGRVTSVRCDKSVPRSMGPE